MRGWAWPNLCPHHLLLLAPTPTPPKSPPPTPGAKHAANTFAAASTSATDATADANTSDDEEDGVKAMIPLAALNEPSRKMEVISEHVTQLQVSRFGAAPKKNDASAPTHNKKEGETPTNAAAKPEDNDAEDTRLWILSRQTRGNARTSYLSSLQNLWPLLCYFEYDSANDHVGEHMDSSSSPVVPTVIVAHEEETTSECQPCLSSPREVISLPCRHLAACRECAVNVVEFGAGGSITQPADDTPAAVGDVTPAAAGGANLSDDPTADADATNATPAAPAAVVPAAVPAPTRRKRKAKGWFCPVCRQPYTSLLRITTQPPPPPEVKKLEEENDDKLEVDSGAEGGSGGRILGSITRPELFSRLSANSANAGDTSTKVWGMCE
ncbi:hypothetical protein DL96DRAFT_1822616 [Flagelloscypha sp. PMI_526]|nr:hypothetical protein DL96DRAFT_1822616 [Flagelloscypha sp. PMI_526]